MCQSFRSYAGESIYNTVLCMYVCIYVYMLTYVWLYWRTHISGIVDIFNVSLSSFIGCFVYVCVNRLVCVVVRLFYIFCFYLLSYIIPFVRLWVHKNSHRTATVPLIRNKFFPFSSVWSVVAQSKPRFFLHTNENKC